MSLKNDILYLLLLYAVLDESKTLTTTAGILIGAGVIIFDTFFNEKEEPRHEHNRYCDDAFVFPKQHYGANRYQFYPGSNGFRYDCNGRCDSCRAKSANFCSSNSMHF